MIVKNGPGENFRKKARKKTGKNCKQSSYFRKVVLFVTSNNEYKEKKEIEKVESKQFFHCYCNLFENKNEKLKIFLATNKHKYLAIES